MRLPAHFLEKFKKRFVVYGFCKTNMILCVWNNIKQKKLLNIKTVNKSTTFNECNEPNHD